MTTPAPAPTLAERVGAALAAARGNRPRRELAREVGIASQTLLKIESGRENLTLARLERVAEGYGVELEVVARERT